MNDVTPRAALTDALRYWEPRRIAYNALLAIVVIAVYFGSPAQPSFELAQRLFVLAVLANSAYCSAYIVDVAVQLSEFRQPWLRYRWVLLAIGCTFAAILARLDAVAVFHLPR